MFPRFVLVLEDVQYIIESVSNSTYIQVDMTNLRQIGLISLRKNDGW